jgi:hypothetical protein
MPRADIWKKLALPHLRSIYTIQQMEGVVRQATQKIGSILFLLCRTTSKSVVQHQKVSYNTKFTTHLSDCVNRPLRTFYGEYIRLGREVRGQVQPTKLGNYINNAYLSRPHCATSCRKITHRKRYH